MPLDSGVRRPLGVGAGAGGLAMLCGMPAHNVEAIIGANGYRYEKFAPFAAKCLREAVARG